MVLKDRKRRILFGSGLVMSLAFVVSCRPWNLADNFMVGAPIGRDFVNFWLGGRIAASGQLSLLTDPAAYNALLARTFDHGPDFFVFSYPPHALLFFVPFGLLPFSLALAIWSTLNVACLFWAARLLLRAEDDGRAEPERVVVLAAACASPAVVAMLLYGHFGGMAGLAATGVLLSARQRPVLAGALLAALTAKPQFAAALGLILLTWGQWRALAAAATGTVLLVGLSALVFGLTAWRRFIDWTLPYHAELLSHAENVKSAISLNLDGLALGLPASVYLVVHVGFAGAVLLLSSLLLRRDGPSARSVGIALLTTLVALPYANSYDLAIAAPALAISLLDERRPLLPLPSAVLLWLTPTLIAPAWILGVRGLGLVLASVTLLAAWRALREGSGSARESLRDSLGRSDMRPRLSL